MQQNSGTFRLIVRRGPQPNQIHEMTKDVVTLGRDITNDITINDPEVSRHHARLTRGGGGYTIEDLGSTNGTFVNGQRLTGARPLAAGDMIGMGETVTLAYESTAMGMGEVPGAGQAPRVDPYAPGGAGAAPGYAPPNYPQAAAPAEQPAPYQQPYAPNPYAQQPPQSYAQQGYPQQPQQGAYPGYSDYGSGYSDYEPEPQNRGMGRWFLLGCGCFIVLCVVGAVVALIIIDQTCAWNQEPLVSILDVFGFQPDSSFSACQP